MTAGPGSRTRSSRRRQRMYSTARSCGSRCPGGPVRRSWVRHPGRRSPTSMERGSWCSSAACWAYLAGGDLFGSGRGRDHPARAGTDCVSSTRPTSTACSAIPAAGVGGAVAGPGEIVFRPRAPGRCSRRGCGARPPAADRWRAAGRATGHVVELHRPQRRGDPRLPRGMAAPARRPDARRSSGATARSRTCGSTRFPHPSCPTSACVPAAETSPPARALPAGTSTVAGRSGWLRSGTLQAAASRDHRWSQPPRQVRRYARLPARRSGPLAGMHPNWTICAAEHG